MNYRQRGRFAPQARMQAFVLPPEDIFAERKELRAAAGCWQAFTLGVDARDGVCQTFIGH